MKPTDIAHLITLGRPTLSPDGRTAVVAAQRADLAEDEYRSQLWTIAVDGSSAPRRLTHATNDSAPRLSPDGTLLAFLRAESGAKPQLHVMATDGGDPRPLTDLPLGAGSPVWAPDSRSIAFVARVPEARRYGQDEKITPEEEPPRRITGLQYRLDGVGFLTDRRQHIYVVDIEDRDPAPQPRQLTDGDTDETDVSWSPDGSRLAFVSARHPRREHDLIRDVFIIGPDGADPIQLTDSSLMLASPTFTADGAAVLARGEDPATGNNGWVAHNTGLWTVSIDDPGRPRRLTDEQSVHLSEAQPVVIGARALVLAENRGAVELLSIPLGESDSGDAVIVAGGRQQITGFDVAADTIVVILTDDLTGAEVAVLRDGKQQRLTDFTARLREHARPLPITEITAAAPDGYPVHGFLVQPEGAGPHPTLLMIHGGPFAAYGWTLFDEAQVYAGAGYAVVYGNPRGSSGYGQAHGEYIVHDVGERSASDLFALLDAALDRVELDSSRVGVLGGSHGGYMTTWLVGHSDRFRAAVSERALNAIDSFEGASDIGWGFGDDLYGPDPEQHRRQSPLTYADAINTPVLIIHSEQDWRCPLEQAQRLYVALRKRDAPVEMLLFPGEGHELSRSGLPSHRVIRFEAIVEWFDRYLR